jgi:integrase/recombinase XerD
MPQEFTLPELVADLVALRHVGGYRFTVPERVLRQFAEHCRREGYADGSITQEALDGFLYARHLRSSTVRRNELALRQLAEHAHTHGWAAHIPAARTRVRASHQPPYVFTDEEVRRWFAATDTQRMSCYSNKAIVDPVLFRVLYSTGLRISEALKLTVSDVDTRAGTLRIRDSKNGAGRTIPITSRLTVTLDAYLTAAHPSAEPSDIVFYSRAPGRQINQATIYMRFRSHEERENAEETRAVDPGDALDAHHFAERFGLFIIILLGEFVVEAGEAAADGHGLSCATWIGLIAAMTPAAAFWWRSPWSRPSPPMAGGDGPALPYRS